MIELTLNQVEKMRKTAGDKIAEVIYEFERQTGLRVDAISLIPYYTFRFRYVDDPPDGGTDDENEDKTSGRRLKIKFNVSI